MNNSKNDFPLTLSKGLSVFLYILLSVILFIQLILFFQFTVDDAFISFRYGYNLVHFHTWNYNIMSMPTEAYTSFLYTVISIIPNLIHIDTVLFFKILSLIILFFFLFYIYRSTNDKREIVYFLSIACIILNSTFFVHLFSGLETPLFMLCLFLTLCYFIKKNIPDYIEYIIIFIFPFIRPEGILFSLFSIYLIMRQKGFKPGKQLNTFIAIIALWIIYFVLRLLYFHSLLPNPFYAKTMTDSSVLKNIILNTKNGFYYIVIFLGVIFFVKDKIFREFALISLIIFIFVYARSELVMDYASRFKFQIFFPFIVFSMLLPYRFFERTAKAIIVLIPVAVIILNFKIYEKDIFKATYVYMSTLNNTGKILNEYKADNYKILIGEAGIIPYKSELETIDFLGLATTSVAKNGIDINVLEKENPNIVVLYEAYQFDQSSRSPEWVKKETMLKEFMKDDFQILAKVQNNSQNFYLTYYIKKINFEKNPVMHNNISKKLTELNNSDFNWKDYLNQKYIIEYLK